MTTPATPDPLADAAAEARAAGLAFVRQLDAAKRAAEVASDIARAQRTEAQIRAIVQDELRTVFADNGENFRYEDGAK